MFTVWLRVRLKDRVSASVSSTGEAGLKPVITGGGRGEVTNQSHVCITVPFTFSANALTFQVPGEELVLV